MTDETHTITLDGEYTTRDGREVSITQVGGYEPYTVMGYIKHETDWSPESWTADGKIVFGCDECNNDLIPKPAPPKTRPMTQAEMIGWAYNEGATGWQVNCGRDVFAWQHPSGLDYNALDGADVYRRRRVHPDGTYGEPEAFEVTA